MAGRIPQSFIDELLNRIDIFEIIDSRVPLKKAGREYHACCPFHNEKTPSFTVSPAKQFYHCFGCGAHGSAISFLMEYDHFEFPDAIEELARSAGLEVPREATSGRREDSAQRTDFYQLLERVDHYYRRQLREHSESAKAIDYLKQRGLSGEIAARYGIGYAPPGWESLSHNLGTDKQVLAEAAELGLLIRREDGSFYDRFRDRVMFPIRDRRGRTIAFGGRVMGDESPKYMNSPESRVFHKGQELYGLFEAKKTQQKLVNLLVVEGYMDVVALAQFNINNAVATLGTATTSEHLERIFRTVSQVVFCFDGDRAGRQAAWRALENVLPVLREGREARFLFLPDGEDPDSLIRKEGTQAFIDRTIESIPLSDFLYESLAQQVDRQSVDGRARLVELARPLLEKLPDSVFRDLMLNKLSDISGLPMAQLSKRIRGDEAPPAEPAIKQLTRDQSRSPVRVAIRLLLEQPELCQRIKRPLGIEDLDAPGIPLLVELLELLRANPHISSGAILEHWRGRNEERHLARLLTTGLTIPEDGYTEELVGAMARLQEQRTEQRTAQLLFQGQHAALSNSEKDELKQLVELRHKKDR